jgi:hypothetical protein
MSEKIERKIDVKEFVRRYDMLKTDEQKNQFVESVIWRKYCPILEKKVILQSMLEKTIIKTDKNVSYIDVFLQKVNFVTTVLLLYTKINIEKNENSESNAFEDYDMLFERNIMNIICGIIGERELNELMSVQGSIIENYESENKTLDAYISKYVNYFATTVGVFANEGAKELVSLLNDKDKIMDIVKSIK